MPNVDSNDERGVLDIMIDGDFDKNGFFYLYYSPLKPAQFRVSRFRHVENGGGMLSKGALNEETVIW